MNYLLHKITAKNALLVFKCEQEGIVTKTFLNGSPEYDQIVKDDGLGRVAKSALEIASGKDLSDKLKPDKRGVIKSSGVPMPSLLVKELAEYKNSGRSPKRLLAFWERLKKNPETRCVGQLFSHIKSHGVTINSNGMMLLVKSVKEPSGDGGYPSHHDRSFVYRIGKPAKVPRETINTDPSHTCGHGVHACPPEYMLNVYGRCSHSRALLLECDPEHAVSVPNDHSRQKIRFCEATPVKDLGPTSEFSLSKLKVTRTKTGDKKGKTITKVKKVVETSANRKEFEVRPFAIGYATDRITVPTNWLRAIGWTERCHMIHTDPRSRYLMVVRSSDFSRLKLKRVPVWEKETNCPPLSIRERSLASCRIHGHESYSVEVSSMGKGADKFPVLIIRPDKSEGRLTRDPWSKG